MNLDLQVERSEVPIYRGLDQCSVSIYIKQGVRDQSALRCQC